MTMYWKFKALFLCFTYIFMDIACYNRLPTVVYRLHFDPQNEIPFTCGETIHVKEGNQMYFSIKADNLYIYEAWCMNAHFKKRKEVKFDIEKKKVYVDIPAVDFYDGWWNCTLLVSKDIDALKYMSVLYNGHYYVKMDCLIQVAINYQLKVTIINTDTNAIQNIVHAYGTYKFKDGVNVKISCGRINQTREFTYGELKIEHCVETECSVKDHGRREVEYEIQLQNHNDQHQMICTYTTQIGTHHRNTVQFILDPDISPVIEIEGISPSTENVYELSASGPNYTASCRRREQRGTLHWKFEISPKATLRSETNYQPIITRTIVPATIQNTDKLICVYTNPLNHITTTDVKFIIAPSTSESPITQEKEYENSYRNKNRGFIKYKNTLSNSGAGFTRSASYSLPHDQIIFTAIDKIMKSVKEWNGWKELLHGVTSTAAKMNFTASSDDFAYMDKINFTCSDIPRGKPKITLEHEGKTTEIPAKEVDKKTFTAEHVMAFTTNISAKCETDSATKMIDLVYVPPKTTASAPTAESSSLDNQSADKSRKELEDKKPDSSLMMWAAIGGGLIVILFLIIGIVKYFLSLKNEKSRIRARGTYENFYNETPAPTPAFPRGPKLEETYLSPADCHESPYSYVGNINDNDTYTVPYTPKNADELYTKVLPKSQRGNTLKPATPQRRGNIDYAEADYAELNNKVPNINNGRYVNDEDGAQYAEIQTKNETYANIDPNSKSKDTHDKLNRNCYTNVFNNEPYVNSKKGDDAKYIYYKPYASTSSKKNEDSDYAEPSYCDMNRQF